MVAWEVLDKDRNLDGMLSLFLQNKPQGENEVWEIPSSVHLPERGE